MLADHGSPIEPVQQVARAEIGLVEKDEEDQLSRQASEHGFLESNSQLA